MKLVALLLFLFSSLPAQGITWLPDGSVIPGSVRPTLLCASSSRTFVITDEGSAINVYERTAATLWSQVATTPIPSTHKPIRAAFDEARGVLVVRFWLRSGGLTQTDLTIEWDGNSWRQLDSLLHGGYYPAVGGAPPSDSPLAYDALNGLVLAVWGTDIFTITPAGWSRWLPGITTTGPWIPPGGTSEAAWDPVRAKLVCALPQEMWELDSASRTLTQLSMPVPPAPLSFVYGLAFDRSTNELLSQNGIWDGTRLQWVPQSWAPPSFQWAATVWDPVTSSLVFVDPVPGIRMDVFHGVRTPVPNWSITGYGTGCRGLHAQLYLRVQDELVRVGWHRQDPNWQYVELMGTTDPPPTPTVISFLVFGLASGQQSLVPFGFPYGCSLLVQPDVFLFSSLSGPWPLVRWYLPIPTNNPRFLGMHFYLQGIAFESEFLGTALSATPGVDCVIGI